MSLTMHDGSHVQGGAFLEFASVQFRGRSRRIGIPCFGAGVSGLGADLQVDGVDLVGVLFAVVGKVTVDFGVVGRRTVGHTAIYFAVKFSF